MNKYEVILNRWMSPPTAEEMAEESDADEIVDDRLLEVDEETADVAGGGKRSADDERRVRRKLLGLSKEQKYEFQQAFRVVAGEGVYSISEEEVYDVMLAMGYTFQDEDVTDLLETSAVEPDGSYSMDSLLAAFDTWVVEQLRMEELSAVFTYLVKSQEPRKAHSLNSANASPISMMSMEGIDEDEEESDRDDEQKNSNEQSHTSGGNTVEGKSPDLKPKHSRYGSGKFVLSNVDDSTAKESSQAGSSALARSLADMERNKFVKNYLTKFPTNFVNKRAVRSNMLLDPVPQDSRLGKGGALAALLYAMQRDLGDAADGEDECNPLARHQNYKLNEGGDAAVMTVSEQIAQDAEDLAREISTDNVDGEFKISFNDFLRLFHSQNF